MKTGLLRKLVMATGLLGASTLCWGVGGGPLPEPGSISLVGIALAAAVYFGTRKKK